MTPSAPALQIQPLADGRFRVGHAMFDDRADARGYLFERFGITPAEVPIIECLARGLQYKQIAVERGLAIKTIEAHMNNIRRKTKTHDKVELVLWAFATGVVDPPKPGVAA